MKTKGNILTLVLILSLVAGCGWYRQVSMIQKWTAEDGTIKPNDRAIVESVDKLYMSYEGRSMLASAAGLGAEAAGVGVEAMSGISSVVTMFTAAPIVGPIIAAATAGLAWFAKSVGIFDTDQRRVTFTDSANKLMSSFTDYLAKRKGADEKLVIPEDALTPEGLELLKARNQVSYDVARAIAGAVYPQPIVVSK